MPMKDAEGTKQPSQLGVSEPAFVLAPEKQPKATFILRAVAMWITIQSQSQGKQNIPVPAQKAGVLLRNQNDQMYILKKVALLITHHGQLKD
jgi:hypothetical protein